MASSAQEPSAAALDRTRTCRTLAAERAQSAPIDFRPVLLSVFVSAPKNAEHGLLAAPASKISLCDGPAIG